MQTTSVIEKNFDVSFSIDDCHKAIDLIIPKFTYLCDNRSKTTNYYRLRKASGAAAAAFDVTFKTLEENKTSISLNCIAKNNIRNLQNQIIEDFVINIGLALEGKMEELNARAKKDSTSFIIWIILFIVLGGLALIFI